MRICADENIAPALSELLRKHLVSRQFSLETVDDHQARSVDDVIWVKRFADAGGKVILSADAAMTTRPHEVIAINEAGLRLVLLDQKWVRSPKHIQIAHLFFWWPRIESTLLTTKHKLVKIPWGWSEADDAIKPLSLDIQRAYKQLKREKTRDK